MNTGGGYQTIDIEVVLALPEKQYLHKLVVTPGTTARLAVRKAVEERAFPTQSPWDPLAMPLGVYSVLVEDDYVVQAGDRIEIYRPLQQDPMELRRQRAKQSND